MLDDSIVRGTTSTHCKVCSKKPVQKKCICVLVLRNFLWPCYYGTDIPNKDVLIACKHTVEEIRDLVGADSLGFLSLESLPEILEGKMWWIL